MSPPRPTQKQAKQSATLTQPQDRIPAVQESGTRHDLAFLCDTSVWKMELN